MANNRNNVITHGSSGKMGNAVFTVDGKMRSKPDISKRVWSPSQKEHLGLFERAKEYARMAISDPELNDFYAAKAKRKHGLGAWHMAIKDFCNPPEIINASFPDFRGKSGNSIYTYAHDSFKVTAVRFSFNSPDGVVLEEGYGSEGELSHKWQYTLKSDIELVPGLLITIYAQDIPGNITSVSLTWPFNCSEKIKFTHAPLPASARIRQKSQLRIRKE